MRLARRMVRGSIVDAVSIRERPASVEDRAVPGHWEGDLLCGSAGSYIVTLVERYSRYVMLARVANRDSRSVVTALSELVKSLPDELLQVADLGSRQRAGRAQALHAGDGLGRLLLRSAKSLAARLQREHQRSVEAVLPQRDQSVSAQPGAVERGRQATQRTTAQDAGLRNTGGAFSSMCCNDYLNRQPITDIHPTAAMRPSRTFAGHQKFPESRRSRTGDR